MKMLTQNMRTLFTLSLFVCLITQNFLIGSKAGAAAPAGIPPADAFLSRRISENRIAQEEALVFPGLLKKEALEAGNPLATYAAMLALEPRYRSSKIFGGIYPEVRFNFEEFLGFPMSGVQAMSLPMYRRKMASAETPIPT